MDFESHGPYPRCGKTVSRKGIGSQKWEVRSRVGPSLRKNESSQGLDQRGWRSQSNLRTTVADPRPTAQHSGQIVTVVPSKRVRVKPEKSSW